MPPVKERGHNRNIKDFFKPFTIPKSRIPLNDVVEEEIVLAPSKRSDPTSPPQQHVSSFKSGGDAREGAPPLLSSPLSSAATLPSTSSATDTPQLLLSTTVAPVDGMDEDASTSASPSSSQRRGLTAVAVPSPPPGRSERPTTNTTQASFSSFSSLTSVPLSTQSSSRRIIKNGMHAVTNSDSGSAESSSSSSEDELEDMSAFVPRKRPKLGTLLNDGGRLIHTPGAVKPSMRQSARLSGGSNRSSAISTPQREVTPPRTVYKHSLLNIARQREREEKAEAKMRQMEADFEESERQKEEESRKDDHGARGQHEALMDDSDEGERMKLAMQRTEPMDDIEAVFIFGGIRHDLEAPTLQHPAFEDDSPPWVCKLQDENWRVHACLTGFLAELVAEYGLPQPLRDWLAAQILYVDREDLREAYVGIVEASKSPTSPDVTNIVSLSNFYLLHQPGPERSSKGQRSPGCISQQPRALSHIIRVLRHFAAQAGHDAIASFVLELMYAALDATIACDPSLQSLIGENIEYLLDSTSDEEQLLTQLSAAFTTSQVSMPLKCRAITALPGCSERTHTLRRRLALEIICGTRLSAPLTSKAHVDDILQRLRNAPEFQVTESTDYLQLTSLICVLDIAIDAGFADSDPSPNDQVQAPPPRKKVVLAERPTCPSGRDVESTFNSQIDALVHQVTLMSSRVKDAGTTHLRRTEAKHAMDRLAKRLEYGVRTKPRPRKKTFGGWVGEVQRSFLDGFLSGRDEKAVLLNENEGHALGELSADTLKTSEMDVAENGTEAVVNGKE